MTVSKGQVTERVPLTGEQLADTEDVINAKIIAH